MLFKWLAQYIVRNYDALLQLDYEVAPRLGAPKGMTISGNAWRCQLEGKRWGTMWRRIIDCLWWLMFEENGHCERSYHEDLAKSKRNSDNPPSVST